MESINQQKSYSFDGEVGVYGVYEAKTNKQINKDSADGFQ